MKIYIKKILLPLLILLGILSFYWVVPKFLHYYFTYPLPMLAGIMLGAVVYAPTLLFLAYMMRNSSYPKSAFLLVPLSVLFYFGLMTSVTNGWFRSLNIPEFLFAGLSEESWKIMPLLLLLLIGKPKIESVKEGVFYGALAGYGFALLEMGAYFALTEYSHTGWSEFLQNALARATLFGTDLHIMWSAFLGGAIVYGLQKKGIKRFFVILGAYLMVVFTHSVQDIYGKILSASAFDMITPLFNHFHLTQEQLIPYTIPLLMYAASVNFLLVNILILPLFFLMLKKGQ